MIPFFRKGTKFYSPDKKGHYILQCDVYKGDEIIAEQFMAVGNVPTPKNGEEIPVWLAEIIIGG